MRTWRPAAALAAIALAAVACGNQPGAETEPAAQEQPADSAADDAADDDDGATGDEVSGTIEIDGSSTVGPLTDAMAELYAEEQPGVTVNLAISGTGGGFERFCTTGDTQISNASRPIEQEEVDACAENGVEYIEVRVGTDALTMVTNPETDFVDCLTTDEAITIWGNPGAQSWNEVNAEFPDQPLEVFAPGADSGTFDFFNEVTIGEDAEPRADYNASEDDNIILQGIAGTPGSWGYFGFAYFANNTDSVKALAYDAGDGCVEPNAETVADDSYKLARPLFIYVREDALADAHVADFVDFYLANVSDVISQVGYFPAPEEAIAESQSTIEQITG